MNPDKKYTRLLTKCNLAVLLADNINTLMMEFEAESKLLGKDLKYESKLRFKMLKETADNLRKRSKAVAADGYAIKDSDSFCDDSDWLLDVLMLIVDRTGDDPEKMTRLRAMIFNMKSEMEIYKN